MYLSLLIPVLTTTNLPAGAAIFHYKNNFFRLFFLLYIFFRYSFPVFINLYYLYFLKFFPCSNTLNWNGNYIVFRVYLYIGIARHARL